jgi:small subunit ribosomal protein S6
MALPKHQYELTYVISGVLKSNDIEDLVKRVTGFVEDNDGEIIEVDEWGSQRLAYEIDKKRSGHYVNMYFHAPGAMIAKLERALEIEDNILRYLTLRMDAKMIRHYERQQRKPDEATETADADE